VQVKLAGLPRALENKLLQAQFSATQPFAKAEGILERLRATVHGRYAARNFRVAQRERNSNAADSLLRWSMASKKFKDARELGREARRSSKVSLESRRLGRFMPSHDSKFAKAVEEKLHNIRQRTAIDAEFKNALQAAEALKADDIARHNLYRRNTALARSLRETKGGTTLPPLQTLGGNKRFRNLELADQWPPQPSGPEPAFVSRRFANLEM
jgi:hypothetical protein